MPTYRTIDRPLGGILLGTGGLARAYAEATVAALDAAGTRQRVLWQQARVTVPVTEVGTMENRLRRDTDVIDVAYGPDRVSYEVAVADLAVLDRLPYEKLDPVWRDG